MTVLPSRKYSSSLPTCVGRKNDGQGASCCGPERDGECGQPHAASGPAGPDDFPGGRTNEEGATFPVLHVNGGRRDPSNPGVGANLNIQCITVFAFDTRPTRHLSHLNSHLPPDSFSARDLPLCVPQPAFVSSQTFRHVLSEHLKTPPFIPFVH